MRISLPGRIFLSHAVFVLVVTVGAGWIAIRAVQSSYEHSAEVWREQITGLQAENLYLPLTNEIGRSLLLGLEEYELPEEQEAHREVMSQAIARVLRAVPSIKGLFLLNRDQRIQFASSSELIDLAYTDPAILSALASNKPTFREIEETEDGIARTRLLVPIYDDPVHPEAAGEREKIGWLFMVFEPDPELVARQPELGPPKVQMFDPTLWLALFVITVAVGSLLVTAVSMLPVRRLETALTDYRARGYRGGLKAGRLAEKGELAGTVRAISELGGQLEALAEHGREREALLATLSQTLEDGMLAVDPEGTPLAWNPAALRALGYPAREGDEDGASGRMVDAEDTDGVRDEVRIRKALERNPRLVSGIGQAELPDQREMELETEDGEVVAARVTRVPLEVRPGETGTLLLFRDMAALKRIETHMLESARYAVLAHLAAGLAHEIRNPLHSIGLNAGVVDQYVGGEWNPERARAVSDSLDSIQDETRRLTELLNNYLGMVRPADRRELVDLPVLCERIVRLMSYTAKRSGVRLRLEGDASVPPIEGVSDRLQQAILNLVLNAIQAMPKGGVATLRTTRKDDRVCVTVADTGPGVPESLRDRLFDLGITTKETGTGLGLPLVRLIAESHGGAVSYRFVSGSGSEFTLALPIEVSENATVGRSK